MSAPGRPQALIPLRAWWQGLAARERSGVLLAAGVLLLGLLWALAVAPAWRTLQKAPAERQALEDQLMHMQRLAGEARDLRAQPALPATQAQAALLAVVSRLGPKARLQQQGERHVLTLQAVDGAALRALLLEARGSARARAVEAQLSRGPQGYSGSLVLVTGAAP